MRQVTDRALALTHEALGVERCRAVGTVSARHQILCQLPDHDEYTRHWAHDPGVGDVEWDDVPVLDADMMRKAAADDRDYFMERSERFDTESGGSGS